MQAGGTASWRLLYLARPASAGLLAKIETVAGKQAVQVNWYDDVNWRL